MINDIQLPQMLRQGVDPESPEIIRLAFARGEVPMGAAERLGVLTCLVFDPSENVKNAALKSLVELEDDFVEKALSNPTVHPLSLELLLNNRPCNDTIRQALASHPNIGEKIIRRFALSSNAALLDTLANNQRGLTKWPEAAKDLLDNPALDLALKGRLASLLTPEELPKTEPAPAPPPEDPPAAQQDTHAAADKGAANPTEPTEDEFAGMEEAMKQYAADGSAQLDETMKDLPENLLNDAHIDNDSVNVTQLIQTLSIAEKIKLATLGSKSARRLLARDTNRVIVNAVIRSPKVQEDEVVAFAFDKTTSDDVLKYILMKKEWLRNYQVRLGLCQNPKTPMPKALRMLQTLYEKDLRSISKSKNVPSVVSGSALRILMRRHKN